MAAPREAAMRTDVSTLPAAAGWCAAFALAAALSWAPAARAAGPVVEIRNPLAECMQAQPGLRSVERGLVLQDVALQVSRPVGECGCKSALVAYRASVALADGAESVVQSGVFGALRSGTRTLALASDTQVVGERPVTLSLGCAPAD